MKQKYSLLKTLFIICLFLTQVYAFAQRDVYLVIGQSNAAGRGAIEAQDMAPLNGVDLYNGTSWETAINTSAADGGMNRYSTVQKEAQDQGLNFSYTFGKTVSAVSENQIGLVVNAIGGTSIDSWLPTTGAGYYEAAITRINEALALGGSTLKGILWHQGEASRNDSDYLDTLESLITSLRTDLGIPNLPVIVGQISKQRTDNDTFNANIKTITDPLNVSNYIPYTDYVTTDGLSTSDRTHFISNSQRVLGYRYAAKILEMIYGFPYVQNEIVPISEDAFVRGGTSADIVQQTIDSEYIRIKETSPIGNNTRRGLVKFDISSITSTTDRLIIDTTLIINADLTDSDSSDDKEAMNINFYNIDTNWTESTVTFNNAPNFTNLISSGNSNFYIEGLRQRGADITDYIKDQYALGTTTVALGLQSTSNDGTAQLKFITKEDSATPSTASYLVVSYINTSSTLGSNTQNNKLDQFKVSYTNPVNDNMLISSQFIMNEINLYSITGKLLKKQEIHNTSATVNTSNLVSGAYIMSITSENEMISKLILKK
ncbi:sialate O-acetylesterase [Algibacter miyuki]|uniref:Sialate O-acetylesterase n=1 Tax=Algibacter miyuki TaxID=1306933 RepID=A0ABV5GUY7_9FLAO|nr:sialate O-acetylesterase [Algibacter miyuki]MDN3664771.1 sialate O-acetylesterase [Algibacter miyuki]